MRKLLLPTLALATAVAVAGVTERSLSKTSAGGLKQITDRKEAPVRNSRTLVAPLALGEAPEHTVEVPFEHDMGKTGTEIVNYTMLNANGDNRKWQFGTVNGYSACMAPNDAAIDENDDWLFTVPIHLPAGSYVVSFEAGFMSGTGARMDVWIGTAPTAEGMTAEVVPPTTYTVKDMTPYQYPCAIPEEGYYYLGFHCTTPKDLKGALKLAKVGMKAGEIEAPADPPAAGTLTWTLAPKGELKATVTYTAPTHTKSGAPLESISKVVITSRWEVDKYEFTDVAPGDVIEQEVEMYAGYNNRFTGVAYVGDTAGDKVEHKNIFCGPDTPLAPANVTLTPSADFTSATLSWDAVGEEGENGGYVDTENVVYYIFDAFGNYYDPAIAEVHGGATSYKITFDDLDGQDFVAYQVTAGNGEYYSLDTSSNIAIVGTPASLPFTESFADGFYEGLWLIDPATNGMQQYGTMDDSYFASIIDPDDPDSPEPLTSHDGDNGFFYWLPVDKDAMMGLQSLRADISGAANPVLDIWYQGQGSMLDVMIAKGNGPLAVARTIDLLENPTTGWTICRVPLDEYKEAGTVNFEVRLRAVHNDDDHIWSVPLDHISIHDLAANDLHLMQLTAPASAKAGEAITLSARIENAGSQTAAGATLEWYVNGTPAASATLPDMEPNAFATVTFDYAVPINSPEELLITAKTVLPGDEVAGNNETSATVSVKFNNFPTVTDLAATTADNRQVLLEWSAPALDALPGPETIVEDFENEEYTHMSISGAGEWTVFDADGAKTYNIFRELYNPYQTQPMAFQLFNRETAQVPQTYWDDAQAHSGNNFMMAPSSQGAANSNWLISPRLSGNAQTVAFWARSYMSAWPESFEVYYSTTDNSPSSFTHKLEVGNYPADDAVPEVWTEFTVNLPEGALYFAIHHNSYDTLALFVDDITYEAAPAIPADLAVDGYHIFRNGAMITGTPVAETSYTDSPLTGEEAEGTHTFTYHVAPIYNHGAATIGNEATADIELSGIEVIDLDSADADSTRYFNLQGIRVPAGKLVPGVYIAVRADKVSKVILR